MVAAGLRCMLNSDDPTMFHTDIGKEYVDLCGALDYGPSQVREFCLNGVEASWLDDTDKRSMAQRFSAELDELEQELA
jgi:adenosine deaminase